MNNDIYKDGANFWRDHASRPHPAWAIYPLPMKEAMKCSEIDAYWESFRRNGESVNSLNRAINESGYKTNFYNLDTSGR